MSEVLSTLQIRSVIMIKAITYTSTYVVVIERMDIYMYIEICLRSQKMVKLLAIQTHSYYKDNG